jgi:hypothetical protein
MLRSRCDLASHSHFELEASATVRHHARSEVRESSGDSQTVSEGPLERLQRREPDWPAMTNLEAFGRRGSVGCFQITMPLGA